MDHNTTNILQPYVGRKTSFGLSVECEVNGEGDLFNLGKDFAEKYRKMLAPFLSMVNLLDENLGVSRAREEEVRMRTGRNPGLLERLNKLPMSFELKPPSLGVGLGIGYATSKNGTITYELDGRLIADPIIGASVKLDILALGSKFKHWGLIIDALDIASFVANLFSGGKVEINYELYFELSAKINLVGTASKDDETKPANITYNFADKKYKGDITLQGVLEGKVHASLEFIYKVKQKSGNSFEVEKDMEKVAGLKLGAEASAHVSLMLGVNFGKDDNWDSDFYFSGVTLKVWAEFGVSDEIKPKFYDIIPDFKKTIKIFDNVGEVK